MNPIPRLSQLSSLVWRVLGCNPGPMTLQGTNIYLVGRGAKRVLIDAGQDGFPEYVENLGKLLKEQNATVDKIIVTHWHNDHIGALMDLPTLFPVLPQILKFPRKEVPDSPLPEGYRLEQLRDSQIIKTDGATLKILFTPGHTTDHAAVYLEEEKAVFSGDCILGEGTAVFEDLHDLMASLERIKGENPLLIYPGHGPVVKDAKTKITFYLEHRRQRESQIVDALRTAEKGKMMSAMDIVKIVYKDTPLHLHPAAEQNVIHHLEKLVKNAVVTRRADKYSIRGED